MEPASSQGDPVPKPSREYRASVAFLTGGFFPIVFVILAGGRFVAGGAIATAPPILGVFAVTVGIVGGVALIAAAIGLSNGWRWAIAIATPMLVLLVLEGALDIVSSLSHATLSIPIGALLAVWALRAPLRTPPAPGPGGRGLRSILPGAVVLLAMLLTMGAPLLDGLLFAPGGPLIVAKDDLLPALVVTCEGTPGTAPTAVKVRYEWRWSRAEPWAAGVDSLTLAAYTYREDGLPGYVLDADPVSSPGLWQSNVLFDDPAATILGIDLGVAGFSPGWAETRFIPPGDQPAVHGTIEIRATYLHAPTATDDPASPALWRVATNARCEW